MRYLFVIMGVGYGHVTRAQAIINEINKNDNDAKFHIVGYARSYEYFKNKYPTTKIAGVKLPGLGFNLNIWNVVRKNLMLPFNWVYSTIKLNSLIKRFNPDIVISEFEPVVLRPAYKKHKKVLFIFNYNLEKDNHYTNKFVLQNGFIKFVYNYAKKYSDHIIIPCLGGSKKIHDKFVYVNPIVRNSPNELANKDALMTKLKLKREPILVMLSGEGFGDRIAEDVINISNKFDEDFVIFGYKDVVKDNVTSFRFNEHFLEYLKVCKGVITLGGHSTLSEILVFRKPALVLPITNHLEQNVNAQDVSYLMMVKRRYKKGQMEELFKKFLEKRELFAKRIERASLRGEGASQLCNILFDKVKP